MEDPANNIILISSDVEETEVKAEKTEVKLGEELIDEETNKNEEIDVISVQPAKVEKEVVVVEKARKNYPAFPETIVCKFDCSIYPCPYHYCQACMQRVGSRNALICSKCKYCYHIACMTKNLVNIFDRKWLCEYCEPEYKIPSNQTRFFYTGKLEKYSSGSGWKKRLNLCYNKLHNFSMHGISQTNTHPAYSIVLSGGYEFDSDDGHEFIYTGQGGFDTKGHQIEHQNFKGGNLGLASTCDSILNSQGSVAMDWTKSSPVRVFRGGRLYIKFPKYAPKDGYRYDGIYKLVEYYKLQNPSSGYNVWQFKFRRHDIEPAPWTEEGKQFMKENNITFDQTDLIIHRKPTAPRKRKSSIIIPKFIPYKDLNFAFIPVVFNNNNSNTIYNNGVNTDLNNHVGISNGYNGTMRGSNNNNNTMGTNSGYNNSPVTNNGYNISNNRYGVDIADNNNVYDFSFDNVLSYNTYDHNAYRHNTSNSNVNHLYNNGLSFPTIDSNLNPQLNNSTYNNGIINNNSTYNNGTVGTTRNAKYVIPPLLKSLIKLDQNNQLKWNQIMLREYDNFKEFINTVQNTFVCPCCSSFVNYKKVIGTRCRHYLCHSCLTGNLKVQIITCPECLLPLYPELQNRDLGFTTNYNYDIDERKLMKVNYYFSEILKLLSPYM